MSRPERSTAAGRAYLDLQRLARTSGRSMQVLLPMFASERWLARLAVSDHRFRFVLKGGVLLAALGNRRPTQDADLLALGISNDHATVIRYVNEIASIDLRDGGTFDPETTIARTIRDNDLYLGVRLSLDCSLASARIKLKLDVNFGDPVTPGPATIRLPTCSTDLPSRSSAIRLSRFSPRNSAPQCNWVRLTHAFATTSTCTHSLGSTGSISGEPEPHCWPRLPTAARRCARSVPQLANSQPPGPPPTAPIAPAWPRTETTCRSTSPRSLRPSRPLPIRSSKALRVTLGTRPPGSGTDRPWTAPRPADWSAHRLVAGVGPPPRRSCCAPLSAGFVHWAPEHVGAHNTKPEPSAGRSTENRSRVGSTPESRSRVESRPQRGAEWKAGPNAAPKRPSCRAPLHAAPLGAGFAYSAPQYVGAHITKPEPSASAGPNASPSRTPRRANASARPTPAVRSATSRRPAGGTCRPEVPHLLRTGGPK